MTNSAEPLGLDEVARFLARLRREDFVRLALLADVWARGIARRDAPDLLNEALARILSGQRPWPADVPFPAFISEVMRSIASHWRHADEREPLVDDCDTEERRDQAYDHDFADLVARMRASLASDPPALGILDHILNLTSREHARGELGLDETGYDTARRRMARTLQRTFKPGWIL